MAPGMAVLSQQYLNNCWINCRLDSWWLLVDLTILTSFMLAAGYSLFFLIVAVTQLFHALYTYKQYLLHLILAPVTALRWLQVTFLARSNQ